MEKEAGQKEREEAVRILIILIAAILSLSVWAHYESDQPINIVVVANSPTVSETSSGIVILTEKPEAKEASSLSEGGTKPVLLEKSIDINSANAEELEQLPGIGPVLAERIIQYREENGGFEEIEEIRSVNGIGDRIYLRISDYIVAR